MQWKDLKEDLAQKTELLNCREVMENIENQAQRIIRMGNTNKNVKDWEINDEFYEILWSVL